LTKSETNRLAPAIAG